MHLAHRFWPAGRKLFRRQARPSPWVPAIATAAGIVLALAVGTNWP